MAGPLRVAAPPSPVPEITVGLDVERVVDEAEKALAADASVYQRSAALVRVTKSVEPPKLVSSGSAGKSPKFERPAGVNTIRVIEHPTLIERMASCARWLKFNAKEKVHKQTLPPDFVARALAARKAWPNVRPLHSVTSAPTMRADGSILQTPGYDASTGILYQPNAPYPSVPESPSHEDAVDAWRCLSEAVCDFPFAKPEHMAAWACSVVTILIRGAIDGPTPLFAIDASTRGSGKSMLSDIAFWIALGHGASRTSLPEDEEEFRKRITSLAIEGDAAVLIDNINVQLGGPSFEAALAGTSWKDRVLGMSGMVTMPILMVWFATGNNLGFSSDVARRTLHIRLESMLENPEDRNDFRHENLIRWIGETRHHLVVWALTIVRAWHVAGREVRCKRWGTFEAWSDVVPQAIAWVSGLDPLLVRASVDESADAEKMAIRSVLACIEHLTQDKPITAKAILTSLYGSHSEDGSTPPDRHESYQGAREAFESATNCRAGNTPQANKVGMWLRKKCYGRVIGGMRLETGATEVGVQTWTVRRVGL